MFKNMKYGIRLSEDKINRIVKRVFNAEIVDWRTTEDGVHFPIREGQTVKETLDSFISSKKDEKLKKEDYSDSPKGKSLEEWMSKPRKFTLPEREEDEMEYVNRVAPLPFFEEKVIGHVRSISKQDRRNIEKEYREAVKKRDEAFAEYRSLKEAEKLPKYSQTVYYQADGADSQSTIAATRMFWKRANREKINAKL